MPDDTQHLILKNIIEMRGELSVVIEQQRAYDHTAQIVSEHQKKWDKFENDKNWLFKIAAALGAGFGVIGAYAKTLAQVFFHSGNS